MPVPLKASELNILQNSKFKTDCILATRQFFMGYNSRLGLER